jgi:hypothetical protein
MVHQPVSKTDKRKPLTPGGGGKLANDSNQVGQQKATQTNQGRRTPASRSDREAHLGSDNQIRGRRGGAGSPSGEGR